MGNTQRAKHLVSSITNKRNNKLQRTKKGRGIYRLKET